MYKHSITSAEAAVIQEVLDDAAARVLSSKGALNLLEVVDGMDQYEVLCRLANIMHDIVSHDLEDAVTLVIED